ncbi:MAG: hypothetical protein ACJ0Q6_08270 [Candidatus Azotimanducaceae bacterium]|uniref:Uncharacterized protein n=1 Tax=OM182 bacterium TaxID=2510334 RepID=A0A520S4B5_9GAMM|nr:MAG: hypothetical protein EVA68_01640 [OM182 bacterium]
MRWASGFVAFGIAYSLFVSVIFWHDWPTIENPHLYGNLKDKLSKESSSAVVKIIKGSPPRLKTTLYRVKHESYDLDSDAATEITIANGETIILNNGTNKNRANEVAQEYINLLRAHVHYKVAEHKFELVLTIFIPLILLTGFAWLSRTVWNVLSKIE